MPSLKNSIIKTNTYNHHTPTLRAIVSAPTALDALNQWAPIVWLKTNAYAYPALETMHIIAIALVFGTLWIVDLRLLGVIRAIDARLLAKTLLPWTLVAFTLALFTGLTMFISRVGDFISNPAFILKMGLLLAAGANAAVLHGYSAEREHRFCSNVNT